VAQEFYGLDVCPAIQARQSTKEKATEHNDCQKFHVTVNHSHCSDVDYSTNPEWINWEEAEIIPGERCWRILDRWAGGTGRRGSRHRARSGTWQWASQGQRSYKVGTWAVDSGPSALLCLLHRRWNSPTYWTQTSAVDHWQNTHRLNTVSTL